MNFQVSTTISNARTKRLETYWMHHVYKFIWTLLVFDINTGNCIKVRTSCAVGVQRAMLVDDFNQFDSHWVLHNSSVGPN